MAPAIDKAQLVARLRELLEADLQLITQGQLEAQAGATHQEAKAEGDKDMRSTETSYLARGLAKRVSELRASIAQLSSFRPRSFDGDSPLGLGALVRVENDEGETSSYFLSPSGGGITVALAADKVLVVTPSSPIGRALIGRQAGDEVELATPQGQRTLCIATVV